jgi:hypothetical protein
VSERRIRVVVTAEDIERGTPVNGNLCPIALALNRLGYDCAEVQDEYADLEENEEGEVNRAYLPAVASQFVAKFDAEEDVQPIAFDLYAEDWTAEPSPTSTVSTEETNEAK